MHIFVPVKEEGERPKDKILSFRICRCSSYAHIRLVSPLSPPVARSYLYATFLFHVFKSSYNSSVLAQVPRVLFHARSYPLSFVLFSEVGVLILTC